jgi:hypothetical protein
MEVKFLSPSVLEKLNKSRLKKLRKTVLIKMAILNRLGYCHECQDWHELDEYDEKKYQKEYPPLKRYISDIDLCIRSLD